MSEGIEEIRDSKEKLTVEQTISYARAYSEGYLNARNTDFENLEEWQYCKIVGRIDSLCAGFCERLINSIEDDIDSLLKIFKGEAISLVNEDKQFKCSALKTWLLSFLSDLEKEFFELIVRDLKALNRLYPFKLSEAIFGLRNMTDENIPIELFESFIKLMRRDKPKFTNLFVGRTLYGLQGLTDRSVPAEFFGIYSENIDDYIESLTEFTLVNSLWGLCALKDMPEAKIIIDRFFEQLEYLLNVDKIDPKYYAYFVQVYNLYGRPEPKLLRNMYQSTEGLKGKVLNILG